MLLPILTRYLSKSEYGEVSMYYTLVSLLGAFIGVNSHSFSSMKFFEIENKEKLGIWNTASMMLLLISSLITITLLSIFKNQISDLFGLKTQYIYMAFATSVFLFITNYRLIQWQVRKKPYQYGIFQVSQAFLNFIITIILITIILMKEDGRINAYFFTTIIFGLFSFYLLVKENYFEKKMPKIFHLKEIWNYGGPLIFHVGGTFLLSAADRVIIKANMTLSDVGIYMVAVQFSLVLSVLFNAFNKAYVPWLFDNLSKVNEEIKLKLVKFTYLYFFIILILLISGIFLGPIIIKLVVGEEFIEAANIIGYLVSGQCFVGLYLMITNYLFYAKKTGVLAIITIGTGILNLVLMFYLSQIYGLKGAAISFAVSMFIRFLITFFVSNRLYPMPWRKAIKIF